MIDKMKVCEKLASSDFGLALGISKDDVYDCVKYLEIDRFKNVFVPLPPEKKITVTWQMPPRYR